ncbi:PLDc N-terminal domain-containing protein [Microbacterium suaedae]|uniref:PLDc N-terminal domain-containing protein n=1 Tax=Microbacterium suaedae TaxID=2067813 RepID=UPI001E5B4F19|nr:PLDc N-terminal domain-containing protein [Microbacterium suaedae]
MMISEEVGTNPLIPAAYDIAWSGMVLLVAAVAITALVSIGRARGADRDRRALWAIAVIVLPVLGSILWFVSDTRRDARARRADAHISSS